MNYEFVTQKLDECFNKINYVVEELKRFQSNRKNEKDAIISTTFEDEMKILKLTYLYAKLAGIIINLYDAQLIILDMKDSIMLIKK